MVLCFDASPGLFTFTKMLRLVIQSIAIHGLFSPVMSGTLRNDRVARIVDALTWPDLCPTDGPANFSTLINAATPLINRESRERIIARTRESKGHYKIN